ncbi:dihydrodipicolinate synthase family protein [Paracoccus suum]|uniref:Dihydrodipicolinate synthase family protein n=1 Tax=Paracoccus suum TaxID=2259340 RepID=A0A344PLE3_9RHOB|nr:dihydrodipicolinate synthase family protein [Paracoccus suum]AXC50198.1 dihydrodipicolinate synthase family protein [Paracoccus suum]
MTLMTAEASGVYVIGATPFSDDGAIDWNSLDALTDFYLERGATGLTVLGIMGEAPKLTQAESADIVRRILGRVDGRVPVVVGVSSPGFAAMGELTAAVMDAGAGGVMIAPPPTTRTDDQIFAYYRGAAEATGAAPIVIQDFPLATSVQMSAGVIARIVEAVPQVVSLKHEDWPGLEKISTLRAPGGLPRRISILCGNGGCFLPEEMERGADGAMTGFAYPEMMRDVIAAVGAGNMDRALDLFEAYLPLVRMEMQPGLGLAVRKHILWKRGILGTPALRKPGTKLGAVAAAEIDRLMTRLDRKLKDLC